MAKRKPVRVKCPHCFAEFKTVKKFTDCEVCGNGFYSEDYKIEKLRKSFHEKDSLWKW